MQKKRIAIFASGGGSNALRIIQHFEKNASIDIALILSNRKKASVLDKAKDNNIETYYFNRTAFYQTDKVLTLLLEKQIDLIVLAGFLWMIPDNLISNYNQKIINIHPALLPKYGGKGMYGQHVHEAVKANNDTESGITIHYVNGQYDEGQIIFQASCPVNSNDTAIEIADSVLKLEHKHFAIIIEQLLLQK